MTAARMRRRADWQATIGTALIVGVTILDFWIALTVHPEQRVVHLDVVPWSEWKTGGQVIDR